VDFQTHAVTAAQTPQKKKGRQKQANRPPPNLLNGRKHRDNSKQKRKRSLSNGKGKAKSSVTAQQKKLPFNRPLQETRQSQYVQGQFPKDNKGDRKAERFRRHEPQSKTTKQKKNLPQRGKNEKERKIGKVANQ